MTHSLWYVLLYQPFYNALIFLISIIPGGDVGIAVILLTILVKIILFPLAKKSITSQAKLKSLEEDLEKIKAQYPNKEEQAKKTFELYKQNKVNPFSGCLVVLVQLPIIFALYRVFFKALEFDKSYLYSFVHFPQKIGTEFLGIINMHDKSIVLALIAGVSQFIQMQLMAPSVKKPKEGEKPTFQHQLSQSMNVQMKYFLPVFITIVAYQVSAAVALYWATSNIFTIIQEMLIRKKLKEQDGMLKLKATVVK